MKSQKLGLLLLLFLFVGVLFSSSVAAATLPETIRDAFIGIVDLATLNDLGGPDGRLLGFMRLVMGVLVFSIIYALSGVGHKFISKNIAITISILLSIITAIFIPGPVLLAIGATYGVIFSFILFGGIILPLLWFMVMSPTKTRGMAIVKLAVLGLLMLIVHGVNSAAVAFKGTGGFIGPQNLGEFSEWVSKLAEYAHWSFVFMAVWLGWVFIKNGDHVEVAGPAAKGAWGAASWGTKKAWKKAKSYLAPGSKEYVRRAHKQSVNEYLAEEREEGLLDEAVEKAAELATLFETLEAKDPSDLSALPKKKIEKGIKKLGEGIEDALSFFRSMLKKTTRRQQTEIEKVFTYLTKKGIKIPDSVKAKEGEILLLHKQTIEEIKKAAEIYSKVLKSPQMNLLRQVFDDPSKQRNGNFHPYMGTLAQKFSSDEFLLEDAYKKQQKAKDMIQGILAETRSLIN